MANVSYIAEARFVTAASAAPMLCACAGTCTNTASPSVASRPTATPPSSATAVGTHGGVTEKEFPIRLSETSLSPASYTCTIQNEGPVLDTKTSQILSPAQSGKLTATLQKGSYALWCSVPGHKNKGMDLTIKVG